LYTVEGLVAFNNGGQDITDTITFDVEDPDTDVVLIDVTQPNNFVANKDGTWIITVRATGVSDITRNVSVGNMPPTASASAASQIDEGTTTPLDGTADDPDGNNDNMTFLWEITSGMGGSITPGTETLVDATFVAPTIPGPAAPDKTFTITLTVTDEDGAETTSNVVTIIVTNLP